MHLKRYFSKMTPSSNLTKPLSFFNFGQLIWIKPFISQNSKVDGGNSLFKGSDLGINDKKNKIRFYSNYKNLTIPNY